MVKEPDAMPTPTSRKAGSRMFTRCPLPGTASSTNRFPCSIRAAATSSMGPVAPAQAMFSVAVAYM